MQRENSMTGWRTAALLSIVVAAGSLSPCRAQYNDSHPPQTSPPPQIRKQYAGPGHAGDWLRRYSNLPPGEQERALRSDPVFRRLPPDRQQILLQRLRHFSSLPPDQQQRMLKRMEIWEHLTPAQKDQARRVHGEMEALPPERRGKVTAAMRQLIYLSPEQRLGMIDSDRFKGMFSPHERDIMRNAARLPLVPPERQGEEGHPPEE
jgi:hypothetical protein